MNRIARWSAVCAAASCAVLGLALSAQAAGAAPDYLKAKPEDMQWWQEARFGLFIHWGPVSLKGTEIGWSRGGKRGKRAGTGEIPVEVYDNLYKEFNPVRFDAREWVAVAKAAGMKYLVFTSRHHDGFSMFDTALSDYKITNSPFGRDVCAELAQACHEAGLPLGWYHSPPDWHHPDYQTENHPRFIEFLHGQVRELLTRYGRVDVLWFDGLGGTAKDWDAENLFRLARGLQPHLIINNRCGLPGDLDTPEQRIGAFQASRPWETCMTICRQWAWKPDDQMKSLPQCLQTLIRCAGGDGNLLFNVGPMPTGEIEPRQVQRLKEMGQWLARYGQSIYGTRGGPWRPGAWGAATCKDNTAYVHVFQWKDDTLLLPPISRKVVGAKALTGGTAQVTQTDRGIEITVAPADRQPVDTLIALELDGPAFDPNPSSVSVSGSLSTGRKARASNVFQNSAAHGPDKALDDDSATRWATDAGVHEAWLEVDLGQPVTFDRVAIDEPADYQRVQAFELQARDGDAWKTFHAGTTIGPGWTQKVGPVTARQVRLNILKATDGPTIWEFQVFAPKP